MNTPEILFALLRAPICGEKIKEDLLHDLTDDDLLKLYSLAKAHDLAHIAAYALSRCENSTSDEMSEKFRRIIMTAAYRYEKIRYELEQICRTLEAAGIPHMPLKGSVIRQYYPEPWLRTSCDIDLLVREEELEKACDVLTQTLHYTTDGKKNLHDVHLYSPGGVHLELHFCLRENQNNIDPLLEKVWEYSRAVEGKTYRYRQTDEYLVFHVLAHMSFHFLNGGCGIRPFIDLYLLKNKMTYDEAVVRNFCAECGLERFYDCTQELIGVWFGNAEHTDVTRHMEEYILSGGVYGTLKNHVAVEQKRRGNKLSHILHRIFLPYENLKLTYPVLQKHRFLTPVFEVKRWFDIVFSSRLRKSVAELKNIRQVGNEEIADISRLLEELGL